MEKMDKAMENRVWQRVHSRRQEPQTALVTQPQPRRESVKPWILTAQENSAAYRSLTLQLIGRQWEPLRRMEMESTKMVQCLRGICALQSETVKLTPLPNPQDPPRRSLEKCFRRTRRLWEEMERRSGDEECGPVYRSLARRAEDHCVTLAELIGRLEG